MVLQSFKDRVKVFMVSVPLSSLLGRIQPLSGIKLVTHCSQQVILIYFDLLSWRTGHFHTDSYQYPIILCPKELQPDMTRILIPNQIELVQTINSNNYGKQQFIYPGWFAHHHCHPPPRRLPRIPSPSSASSSSISIDNRQHRPSVPINHCS